MPETIPAKTTNKLLTVVVVFLTGAALKLAAPVVIALLLTVLLVYLIDPLVVFLHRRRLPLWLSALIAIVFFVALFLGLGVLIFFDLPHFGRNLPPVPGGDPQSRAGAPATAWSDPSGSPSPSTRSRSCARSRSGPSS